MYKLLTGLCSVKSEKAEEGKTKRQVNPEGDKTGEQRHHHFFLSFSLDCLSAAGKTERHLIFVLNFL